MPVLQVHALPQSNPKRIPTALKQACVAIAQAYGCPVQQVFATWEEIAAGHYVDGEIAANTQPPDSHPPLATLMGFEGKSQDVIEATLKAAAAALCDGLCIPNNIFITYHEALSGRTMAGNDMVRRK